MEIRIFDVSLEKFIKSLQKPTIAKVLHTKTYMLYRRCMRRKTYKQFKKELLRNREIRQVYEKLGPEFAVIEMIIKKRMEKGLSQKELARKIGTKQSAISRLESGTYNPTLSFLQKVVEALDAKLKIALK